MMNFASAFRLLTIVIFSQIFVSAQTKTEPQKGNPVPRLTSSFKATPKKPTEPTQTYQVGIGDILDVRVRDIGNQSKLLTVTANGLLEYPVLNQPLQVAGLTIEEIGEKLKSELERLALNKAPEVLIGVREYNSHTILVGGLVKDPGTKILRREAMLSLPGELARRR